MVDSYLICCFLFSFSNIQFTVGVFLFSSAHSLVLIPLECSKFKKIERRKLSDFDSAWKMVSGPSLCSEIFRHIERWVMQHCISNKLNTHQKEFSFWFEDWDEFNNLSHVMDVLLVVLFIVLLPERAEKKNQFCQHRRQVLSLSGSSSSRISSSFE